MLTRAYTYIDKTLQMQFVLSKSRGAMKSRMFVGFVFFDVLSDLCGQRSGQRITNHAALLGRRPVQPINARFVLQ